MISKNNIFILFLLVFSSSTWAMQPSRTNIIKAAAESHKKGQANLASLMLDKDLELNLVNEYENPETAIDEDIASLCNGCAEHCRTTMVKLESSALYSLNQGYARDIDENLYPSWKVYNDLYNRSLKQQRAKLQPVNK